MPSPITFPAAINPYDTVSGFWYAGYSLLAGSPAATWYNIGSTEDGWRIRRTLHEEDVKDDAYGEVAPDRVNMGSSYSVTGTVININAAVGAGVFDAQVADGRSNNDVGLLASSLYGSLALTPLPGTPNAKLIGAGNSIIFGYAAIANEYEVLRSSHKTTIPVTWNTLPDQNNGNLVWRIASSPYSLPASPPI